MGQTWSNFIQGYQDQEGLLGKEEIGQLVIYVQTGCSEGVCVYEGTFYTLEELMEGVVREWLSRTGPY